MKRLIAAIVVAALIAPALPAFAAEGTESPKPAVSLRESATRAVAKEATAAKASTTANAYGPRSMPRQPNDGVRNQGGGGGGHAGMIIGLVSTAAGIAATVYMVKMMKKSTSDATKTN
jgi:hypothetical protein